MINKHLIIIECILPSFQFELRKGAKLLEEFDKCYRWSSLRYGGHFLVDSSWNAKKTLQNRA